MIVATVRTLNEEENIARFCRAYAWVDCVIVSDGGSGDRTVEIAAGFPNVMIDHYEIRYWKEKRCRTPQGAHVNHIFRLAKTLNPDWILSDDCDSLPTKAMGDGLADILMHPDFEWGFIYVYHLYVYGTKAYFPDMNKPGQSFYGFNPKRANMVFDENDPVSCNFVHKPQESDIAYLTHPMALLHYAWPTEEVIQRKIEFYKFWKKSGMLHPTEFGGELEALPDWATPGEYVWDG